MAKIAMTPKITLTIIQIVDLLFLESSFDWLLISISSESSSVLSLDGSIAGFDESLSIIDIDLLQKNYH